MIVCRWRALHTQIKWHIFPNAASRFVWFILNNEPSGSRVASRRNERLAVNALYLSPMKTMKNNKNDDAKLK